MYSMKVLTDRRKKTIVVPDVVERNQRWHQGKNVFNSFKDHMDLNWGIKY